MAGYLEDLDELILKCRNKNAREYIRESVASYRADAYRSAIVSCWVAVCYDLIEKLRELSLAGDKQAAQKIELLDAIHRESDTARSLKFEREILDFARDKLELISALERLCCTNSVWDSSHESSVVAGMHEQTYTPDLQDQELASLQ